MQHLKQGIKYLILAIAMIVLWRACFPHKFDSKEWQNHEYRTDTFKELMNSHRIDGKTKKEVKELLGDPESVLIYNFDSLYHYSISYGSFISDFNYCLDIYFKNDTVSTYTIND
jgi:hypothetical protein